MSYDLVDVNPQEVRFSQDSISSMFTRIGTGAGTGRASSIHLARAKIQFGLMKASDFPPIEIYKDGEGVTWSKDNRRLWVFRMAGLTSVPAKLYSSPLSRVPPVIDRQLMADADFFPRVRRGKSHLSGLFDSLSL